jgi:hypothetical protein
MTAKHSPGPWWVSDNFNDMRPEAIHEGRSNCIVATTWSIVPEDMRKANARLIAASPSLLDACKAALPICDGSNPAHETIHNQLCAAIAAAEGGEL